MFGIVRLLRDRASASESLRLARHVGKHVIGDILPPRPLVDMHLLTTLPRSEGVKAARWVS